MVVCQRMLLRLNRHWGSGGLFPMVVQIGAKVLLASGSGSSMRQLKDGDVLGIAIDHKAVKAYIHVNGAWQTSRPGSSVGKLLIDGESFFSIALGENEKLTLAREGARRYPVSIGYLFAKVPVVPHAEVNDGRANNAASKQLGTD